MEINHNRSTYTTFRFDHNDSHSSYDRLLVRHKKWFCFPFYTSFSGSYINRLLLLPLSIENKRLFHIIGVLKSKNSYEKDDIIIDSKNAVEKSAVLKDGRSDYSINSDPELKEILEDIRKDFKEEESCRTPADDGGGAGAELISGELSKKDDEDFSFYEVAEDIEEYEYLNESDILSQQTPHEKTLPISLERGNSGVFDLNELVFLLQELGCIDVTYFPIPPEYNFCDNMVIASAKSMRHMRALHEEIYWIYKRKKGPDDPYIKISGTNDTFWCAMDMGNIVVHLFFGDAREYYDIESLWTKRPEDDQKQYEEISKYELSPEDLFWLETQGDKGKVKKAAQKEKDNS